MSESIDAKAVVAEIEADVARRRANGEYPAAVLEQLHADFRGQQLHEPPEALALIQSSHPLHSDKALLGSAIVVAKKVTRRLLGWYIQPLARDQTRFNNALLIELRRLETRLRRVETPWEMQPSTTPEHVQRRGDAIVTALSAAPSGPVIVVADAEELPHRLQSVLAHQRDVIVLRSTRSSSPLDYLEQTPTESAAAIVLAGVLTRLAPAELLAVGPAAGRVLTRGGLLIVDAPDPTLAAASHHHSANDLTMQRWVTRDTIELIATAAGLTDLDIQPVNGTATPWFLAYAERP